MPIFAEFFFSRFLKIFEELLKIPENKNESDFTLFFYWYQCFLNIIISIKNKSINKKTPYHAPFFILSFHSPFSLSLFKIRFFNFFFSISKTFFKIFFFKFFFLFFFLKLFKIHIFLIFSSKQKERVKRESEKGEWKREW